MSHALQGHPRWTSHSEEFCKTWSTEEEMEITPVFLLKEPREQYEKANRYDTGR